LQVFSKCCLENYSFNVRKEEGELYVGNGNWDYICDLTRFISRKRPAFKTDAIKVLTSRLEKEQNPHGRSAIYLALGHSLRQEGVDYTLLNGLINEDSPQAVKGIGFVCANTQNERLLEMIFKNAVKVSDFVNMLERVNKNQDPLKMLCELDTQQLSPEERLIIVALRIVSGDTELSKSLLGIKTIPPPQIKSVNEKLEITYSRENKESHEALKRLHHNAFIFLASTGSRFKATKPFPEYMKDNEGKYIDLVTRHKQFVMNYLEKNLEFNIHEIDRLDPENWGEKVAALIEVYKGNRQTSFEQESISKEHGEYLDNFFFGKGNSVLNLWGNALLRQALREKGGSDFELSGGELAFGLRDFEDKYPDYKQEYRKVRREINIARLRMAEGIIRSAEDRGLKRLTGFVVEDMPQGYFTERELEDPYKYLRLLYDWEETRK